MAIRRRVSIKDVAARAGVNRSTVSRALRLDPRITAATTATVLEAARRLGYVPHSGARALAIGRTQVVTVIVASLREVFVQLTLEGIEDALLKTDYRLRIETAHSGIYSPSSDGRGNPRLATALEKAALAGEADGVILISLGFPDKETEQIYQAARFPIVLIEGRCDWGGRVALDNVKAGRLAVEHLFSRGRRRLALANGDRRLFQSYAERQQGFMEAMKVDARTGDTPMPWESREARRPLAAGLRAPSPAKPMVFETDGVDHDAVDDIAQRLVEHRDHIDGVVVATGDLYAIRLIEDLRRAGVRVPEDMAVIGFDDLPEAQAFGLSSIHQPFDQFGHKAVAMLLEMMQKKRSVQAKEWLAQPHLVQRQTT